jgi:N-acetylneuraminic acid mutarotase
MKSTASATVLFAIAVLMTACGGSNSAVTGTTNNPPPSTTDEWAWISGSNYASSGAGPAGVYGTLGTASAGNVPGGRDASTGWTDSSGNLWIFGGFGFDATGGTWGDLNDVWKFSPSSNQWTWMGGSNKINAPGVYGTEGVAAAQNIPSARYFGSMWTDGSGKIWMFGGTGYFPSVAGGYATFNDLWMFDPATNLWTWMGGSQTPDEVSVYGTLGVPGAGNQPGARSGSARWVDANGNFWMFGGYGFWVSNGTTDLSDLWEYDPKTQQWTWVGGSNVGSTSGVYGTLGVAATGNQPGARENSVSWTDTSGNFWLFGGYGLDSSGNRADLNDLWEFSPSTMQWTWVSGTNQVNAIGNYGTEGNAAASNSPGARDHAASWKDSSGDLWLFGGDGYAASGSRGDLNDLWKFDPTTRQWTWVSGGNQVNSAGTYGTEGTFASGNAPAGRDAVAAFTDKSGNFWLFGGTAANSSGPDNVGLNDLWRFTP